MCVTRELRSQPTRPRAHHRKAENRPSNALAKGRGQSERPDDPHEPSGYMPPVTARRGLVSHDRLLLSIATVARPFRRCKDQTRKPQVQTIPLTISRIGSKHGRLRHALCGKAVLMKTISIPQPSCVADHAVCIQLSACPPELWPTSADARQPSAS